MDDAATTHPTDSVRVLTRAFASIAIKRYLKMLESERKGRRAVVWEQSVMVTNPLRLHVGPFSTEQKLTSNRDAHSVVPLLR